MSKQPIQETPAGSLPAEAQDWRDRIQQFEQALKQSPGQFTPDLMQFFCAGVYLRQVFFPAGTMVTGKIHRYPCLNILVQGELEVVTEEGIKMMVAPMVFKAPAGVKRAARVISDTIWITVHAYEGEERDGNAMADLLTVPSYDMLESHCPRKQNAEE